MSGGDAGRRPVDGHATDGVPAGCTERDCVEAAARGDRWIGPFLSLEPGGRAHFHHRDTLHERVRRDHARRFRQLAATYDSDPSDFAACWTYLSEHPVFHRPVWTRSSARSVADLSPEELATGPGHVEDCDGLRNLWMHVSREDGRTTLVHLEHGPHLWPEDVPDSERWCTPVDGLASHDVRLDVAAPSYEEAVVALAAKVRLFYGHDRGRVAGR